MTANFLTHWQGMRHEDWRYEAFRGRAGSAYWVVSFFGFHLVPTFIVFAACVPVYVACTSSRPFGVLDVVAAAIPLVGPGEDKRARTALGKSGPQLPVETLRLGILTVALAVEADLRHQQGFLIHQVLKSRKIISELTLLLQVDVEAQQIQEAEVEMLGGGLQEPMLAILPDRDARGQLEAMADRCEQLFGQRPRGMWLAERVWEPDLPRVIARAGGCPACRGGAIRGSGTRESVTVWGRQGAHVVFPR